MIFRVDFDRLVQLLLPTFLRKGLVTAFLTAFIQPLKGIYAAFTAYRRNNLYMLEITPQTCYLEKCLNDMFDPTLRRITIHDSVRATQAYVYLDSESKPLFLNPSQPVYQDGEIAKTQTSDFVVSLPATVTDITRVKAVLDKYKLPTKQYEIK